MTTELTYLEDDKQREMFKAFMEVDKRIPKSDLKQRPGGGFLEFHVEEMYIGWKLYAEYLKFLKVNDVVIGYAKVSKGEDGKSFVSAFSAAPELGYVPVGPKTDI